MSNNSIEKSSQNIHEKQGNNRKIKEKIKNCEKISQF